MLSVTNGKPGISRVVDADDDLLGLASPAPPLIPDGEYVGTFLRAEKGRYAKRERWFLWFAIHTPGHIGLELYLSCPFPEDDGKDKKRKGCRFGFGSKLVEAYAVATGKLPRRPDRISKEVFRNKMFRFLVRTVTKDKQGDRRPEADWYSVIDRLLAVETGKVQQ